MRIRIIRTAPLGGVMVSPGAEIDVEDGLGRTLIAAGKAVDDDAACRVLTETPAPAPASPARGRRKG